MGDTEGTSLTGRCHCGAVHYTISTPIQFSFVCHCDSCRRLHGGCRMAGASVSADALAIEGERTTYRYDGGKAPIEFEFCRMCGTPMCARPEAYPGVVVVRGNTFDDPNAFVPSKSIFEGQACAWDTPLG